ncbi:hypothetical protein EC973_003753 [Apophysomyces ossiformis]|uniref:Transcription elongation factor Eaf N-terminal domain-containing protein n=1 Tax=Apophysomyces ossiformis TaxID=679940 RepID=A0A8H7BL16_9FUNG|nr:hypothetical protein EC973_003753 [Apophysomyces ossiformis]
MQLGSPIEEENLPARRVSMYEENNVQHMEWSPLQSGGSVSNYEAVPGNNQDFECLLIYDEETQSFVLERQTMRFTMKKTLKRRLHDQNARESAAKPEKAMTPLENLALPPRQASQISTTPTNTIQESSSDDFDLDISKDMDEILGNDDDEDDQEEGEIVSSSNTTKHKSTEEDIFEEVTPTAYRSSMGGSSSVPPPTQTTPYALPPMSGSSSSTSSPALQASNGAKRRKYKMASAPIRHIEPSTTNHSPHLHPTPPTVSPAVPLPPTLAVPSLHLPTPAPQHPPATSRHPAARSSESEDESSSGSSSGSSGSSSSSGSDNDSDSSSGSSSGEDDDDDEDDFDTLAEDISRSLSKEGSSTAPPESLSPQVFGSSSSPGLLRKSPLENPSRNTPTPGRGAGGGGPMSLRALFHEDDEEENLSGSSSGSE